MRSCLYTSNPFNPIWILDKDYCVKTFVSERLSYLLFTHRDIGSKCVEVLVTRTQLGTVLGGERWGNLGLRSCDVQKGYFEQVLSWYPNPGECVRVACTAIPQLALLLALCRSSAVMKGTTTLFLCVFATVATLTGVRAAIDVKAWLGEEPLTPERILEELVEYFSQRDPQGIPVLKVPEPIEAPDKVTASQITLWDLKISGHSGLRLEYINVNLTTFTAVVRISVPKINVLGQYEWPGWWSTSAGSANITISDIQLALNLQLGINTKGLLMVDGLQITLNYEDLILGFEGLSSEHSLLVTAADTFFSTIIQPLIVGGIQDKLTTVLNERLEQRLKDQPFPNSISPVDYLIAKVRRDMRESGKDPIVIERKDVNLAWGVSVQLKNIEIKGLTTLHRTHEVSAQFIDNALFVTIQIGTQQLKAGADWSISASLMPAVGGHLDVEVESLSVTVMAKQPADIRSPPVLREIDIQLGNLAVRSVGESTMDYLVELMVNLLPNTFRNIIMDKIEPKIHQAIQKQFNGLDIHRIILTKLAEKRQAEANASP
ncbi:uncharacterized protein [Penaeus vannamei]|uniref:uncharacterized protein n=1 Tax=Penaeus vannamei TaxID=6689 RepID=UPI00387F3DC5